MPSPILTITRTLTNGGKISVGRVGEGSAGIYFQWEEEYLRTHPKGNLSPFRVPFQAGAVRGPDRPNNGLHGFLADSLPDGWGLLLMDRCFSAHHINPLTVTPLERLAFMGERAMGALSFVPEHSATHGLQNETLFSLQQLGMDAVQMFESETAQMLPILMETGSSAGSRPKSALWLSADGRQASSIPKEDFQPWLLKFSSSSLPLGLDEGVWEAAALTCAQRAGIATSNWRLFSGLSVQGKPVQWLGMKRFDRTARGRMYFVSAAGLLDADFRQPSLDYEQLVRLALWLTQSHTEVMEMLRRAIFNI